MRTDADDARDIARDIALALIEKTGVQEYKSPEVLKDIAKRSVEVAKHIVENIPQPRQAR